VIGNLAVGIQDFVIPAPQGDFESIATVVVGSGGASNVEFTSIPGTYQHLQLRWLCRTNRNDSGGGDTMNVTFNSDTGSNYARHDTGGTGSSVYSEGFATQSYFLIQRAADAQAGSNTFGVGVIDLLDYANTNKFTTARALGGFDNNGGGRVAKNSGLWRNANAFTSIKLVSGFGTGFLQHSHFALYGIKG
jgi:hypothetical protein